MTTEIPEWAMKLATALTIHFGAETTEGQRDETYKNIARALVGIHEAANDVAGEIVEIMETYDCQMATDGYVSTPGGLEHMGDVWCLLEKWRDRLTADNARGC